MVHEIATIYPLTENSFSGALSSLLPPNALVWGAEKVALQGHCKSKAGLEVLQDGLSPDCTGGDVTGLLG